MCVLTKRNAPDTPPGTGAFHTSKQSGGAHGAVYKVRTPVASGYGEGWMPGAAEDLRPGGLPKACALNSPPRVRSMVFAGWARGPRREEAEDASSQMLRKVGRQ